ncbi:MAG: NAD(P)/FAD-dependent oxidoreductase [Verrucomicrobiae bacterium]|nr:NAD(P)/FAD-dependent oxidoreductase [Verrucomicrobiae bacterium]
MRFDVIVLGGGAAGLFCAANAGARGRKVAVLERSERVGKKIAISGGGRCNFTNTGARPECYLSQTPSFCVSALARYTPTDFVALVDQHGIAFHEKKLGQLFCDFSSKAIIQMLERDCAAAGAEILTSCLVEKVGAERPFRLQTNRGEFECESLVVATGGLSFANLGATAFGYEIAKQFGIKMVEVAPGLVPLTWGPAEAKRFAPLSGIAIECEAAANGAAFRENLLFTHRGLSGPAILQASSYWRSGEAIRLDLLPNQALAELVDRAGSSAQRIENFLSMLLPRRFVETWIPTSSRSLAQWSRAELERVFRGLKEWSIAPAGTEGYPKAEVTLGGVDATELSSKTMQARRVPGLYFIGEVVDVTGWLGGYNFQWAWSSAHAAAQYV